MRQRLANRRQSELLDFEYAGNKFSLGFSKFDDGRLAEIFVSSERPGSPIEAIARDSAIAVSFALQCGAELTALRAAMTRDHDSGPASPLGAALDALEGHE